MKPETFWQVQPRQSRDLLDHLLSLRGVTKDKERLFFNPKWEDLSDPLTLPGVKEAKSRITAAIKNKEKIVVYGDYDVDGISATAVLWEAIHGLGGEVLPYIPDRFSEGYGINPDALRKLAKEDNKLIISVDSGISAYEEISLAKKLGLDFIVTDHHLLPKKLPPADAIVHTTMLAGAGVSFKLAQALTDQPAIELAALGTIADILPLVGENRIIAKLGLEELKRTSRPGLLALYEEATINRNRIGTYEVGFMIGPRLNAMGRLEHAIDSLRILLTTDPARARDLAKKLSLTNDERRRRMISMLEHAQAEVGDGTKAKLWVVSSPSYEQGIIGLIAGRLADQWHRPVIAIAEGKEISKGSARSIDGFDVATAIASAKDFLISFGGHPQAAGFTIATKDIFKLRNKLAEYVEDKVDDEDLQRKMVIDAEVGVEALNLDLARKIAEFAPFGPGNTEPLFLAKKLTIGAMRLLSENKHLRVELGGLEAIGFGMGPRAAEIRPGMGVDAVFSLEENIWQERSRLQLKLRDFRVVS